MSGIYISGMEMPKAGEFVVVRSDGEAYYVSKCPKEAKAGKAIPVHDHGRLGDLDALFLSVEYGRDHHVHTDGLATRHHKAEFNHFLTMIANMPTVIPKDVNQ